MVSIIAGPLVQKRQYEPEQLRPVVSYRSKALFRDSKGVYKISAESEGEGRLVGTFLSPSILQIIVFSGMIILMLWTYFRSLRLALIAILAWPFKYRWQSHFFVHNGRFA